VSPDLVLRRLVAADLPAYKALRDEALAADPTAFTSDAATEAMRDASSYLGRLGLDRPEGGQFVIGAWRDDRLVGAIGCERDLRVKVRHLGHVIGTMVRTDERGRGLGRALLDALIAEARRADGIELLTLTVTAGNAPAIRLYEGTGFVRCGTQPRAIRVDGRDFDKDLMVLVL
jgi:ribosomal protein S18 acetylase RimI-like enzyme